MAVNDTEALDQFEEWFRNYYRDEIGLLAQRFPQEQKSLVVDYQDLYRFDPDLADDWTERKPETAHDYAEEALRTYDLPVDIDLSAAHVRLSNLPDSKTIYPNQISPTKNSGKFRAVRGDVLVASDTYSKILKAAFECQRCGTLTRVPQKDDDFQEPHECKGCERQGPFRINHDQSQFIDGETFQLQTPPEKSQGMGRAVSVFVEDDLTDMVEMGDTVVVSGTIRLQQKTNGNQKTGQFEPYLEAQHIEIEEGQRSELDIEPDKRTEIEQLADGSKGDPLQVAAESFAPEVHGYTTEKKALVLAIVGGATNTPGIRGKFHVLLIGDPSTSKSLLIQRVKTIALRSLSVSGQQSTSAGLTSTATQGEFSDGRWTLQPGAFVKANEGVVTIDELDDMDPDDRKSMLEPMANQEINVTKAGINATLKTKTGVAAAANPKQGRFDPYEPLDEQFGFESNLLSRFDLVFTFRDQPDESNDTDIADHTTQYRDAKIRKEQGLELSEEKQQTVEKPVDDETLSLWLALAARQPDPVYANDDVRKQLRDKFVTLRGANGYADDVEVPVTFRKLPGVERVARAYAKLEFSPVVEQRHADLAMELVGQSMQDYQTNEEGDLDADIAETGASKSQKERMADLENMIKKVQKEYDDNAAPEDEIVENLSEIHDEQKIENDIDKLKGEGAVCMPEHGKIRWIGRYT